MAVKFWTGQSGDSWSNSAAWSPAGAPAAADDAIIAGYEVASTPDGLLYKGVNGPGTSSSLTIGGAVSLGGSFSNGVFVVGDSNASAAFLIRSGKLATKSALVLNGSAQVAGAGVAMTIDGKLSIGGQRQNPASFSINAFTVSGGARVQTGGIDLLKPPAGVTNAVSVDDGSILEVGTTGIGEVGRLTIGAKQEIKGTGLISAARGIANQGLITADKGTLVLASPVTGAGRLQIADGATLSLTSETAASTEAIQFLGQSGTLGVGLYNGFGANAASGINALGTVGGFQNGHAIRYAGGEAISAASYRAGPGGTGTLTLFSGAKAIGSLTLAGTFAADAFQVTPATTSGYDVSLAISLPQPGPASAGTAGPDAFAWIAGSGGSWTQATNWRNETSAAAATLAPGRLNDVSLRGTSAAAYQVVTGPGAAARLSVLGNVTLRGAFTAKHLTVGSQATAGALSLAAGTTLAAETATLLYGPLQVTGPGTTLSLSGTLTLGGPRAPGASFSVNALTVNAGAVVQVGALVLDQSAGGVADSVTVDASATLDVGAAARATPGQIVVDAGRSLRGAGSLAAAAGIVNDGTIMAESGTLLLSSPVSGAGTLMIGAGATLAFAGSKGLSTAAVRFSGAGGRLEIGAYTVTANGADVPRLAFQGVVAGFAPGDVIAYEGDAAVTKAAYRPTGDGTGTLTLLNGDAVVGTLALNGDYTGFGFRIAPDKEHGYDVRVVAVDPLFDADFYLARNPDVAAAGIDPYAHYVNNGWREGRDPAPLFNTRYYLSKLPEGGLAPGVDPLTHFETIGWKQGLDPSLGFSVANYLAANPDVAAKGVNPLVQYVAAGKAQGRAAFAVAAGPADPGVDAAFYYASYPDVRAAGIDASAHYHGNGASEGRMPNAWFDTKYYLSQNPDVRAARVDPLYHYERNGWKEGRDPSLVFSGEKYLGAYQDVKAAGIVPLLHYMRNGKQEGRAAFLAGGRAPADPLVDPAYYGAQLGATLIPSGQAASEQAAWSYDAQGWRQGLNPDRWFDTRFYLSANPDVAAAHVNPLLHFERHGWREGRNPSAQFSLDKYLTAYADVKAAGLNPLAHYIQYGQGEGRSAFAA